MILRLGLLLLALNSCLIDGGREEKPKEKVPTANILGSKTTRARTEKNATIVDLDEDDSDKLIMKWTEQALSGVMAAIAHKKLDYLTKDEKKRLEKCSKLAESIEDHAQCIMPAVHASKHRKPQKAGKKKMDRDEAQNQIKKLIPKKFDTTDGFQEENLKKAKKEKARPVQKMSFKHDLKQKPTFKIKKSRFESLRYKPGSRKNRFGSAKVLNFKSIKSSERYTEYQFKVSPQKFLQRKSRIGSFVVDNHREKRSSKLTMRSDSSYNLSGAQSRMTPIGAFAKFLLAGVMKEKNRTMEEHKPWQNMVEKARYTAVKRREMKKKYRMKSDLDPLEEMAFRALENRNLMPEDIDKVLDKMQNDVEYREIEQTKANRNPVKKAMSLMREGMKLGYMLAGKNMTNFDQKTLKVMSPRFMSVLPEEGGNDEEDDELDPLNLLSPSIFSLHPEGKGIEKELSIPNLIKSFTAADQQMWLDLIFEASGVEEAMNKAEKALIAEEFQIKRKRRYADKMVNDKGEPLYLTKETAIKTLGPIQEQRDEMFDHLQKSYSSKQLEEMNSNGFAILTKAQIQKVYGKGSVHADEKVLKRFLSMNESQIHQQIEKDVTALAERRSVRRKRDIVLTPFLFANVIFQPELVSQPIILSPILFTNAIGSPAVLGPIILGPWLFLPLILSPRVLSPAILNPFLFVPIILSPLVLHPAILCPGLFNPFILSPLLLTPFILSPQVFTPLILTPLCLSPFILTPTFGGPVILSPFVLTPVIYSPLALFALVLSPNALSPLVESKLFMAEVVLSPSYLS